MASSSRKILVLGASLAVIAILWVWSRSGPGQQPPGPDAHDARSGHAPAPARELAPAAVAPGLALAEASAPSLDPPSERPAPSLSATATSGPAACLQRCGMPCLADGECPPACETNEDCEGLAYCSPTFAEGDARMVHRCVQQDCAGPSDKSSCGPGRSCVPMSNEGSGVYRCLQAGLRKVGEPCLLGAELNPHSLDQVCGPGLKCLDSCMPIQCEEDADCPGGRCAMMRAHMQKSCLPGCKVDADCPAWQRCATASIGLRCVPRASPKTCIEEGCPDGLRCVPYMPLLALQVAECRPPCETTDDCPGGQVCLDLGLPFQEGPVCVVPCTSDGSCGPGLRCLPHPSTDVAVCGIDPGAHVDAFFRGFGDVRSASEPDQ